MHALCLHSQRQQYVSVVADCSSKTVKAQWAIVESATASLLHTFIWAARRKDRRPSHPAETQSFLHGVCPSRPNKLSARVMVMKTVRSGTGNQCRISRICSDSGEFSGLVGTTWAVELRTGWNRYNRKFGRPAWMELQ